MDLEDADNPEGSLSIKALKVFDIEKARIEFKALQEARQIVLKYLESNPDAAPIARVPKAIGFDEVIVDKKTQDFLNKNGAAIVDGRVGVITMDWIEGKDLGVMLREELSKLIPEGEDIYQSKLWDDPNCTEVIRILEKRGFVLPEAVVVQLKNLIELIHKNGLSHGDLHPGNVILKDGDLENPQLYVIDWADAVHGTMSIDETEGEYFMSDEKIVKSLTPLTQTPEAKKKKHGEAMMREWDERIASIERQPKAQQQYESLKTALMENRTNMLEGQFMVSLASDSEVENFLGNLLKLAREDENSRAQILQFIDSKTNDRKSKIRSFVLNRMRALREAIEI